MCLWIDTAATKQVEKRCIFHMSLTSQGRTPQIMLFVLAVLHIKWRQIGCCFFFLSMLCKPLILYQTEMVMSWRNSLIPMSLTWTWSSPWNKSWQLEWNLLLKSSFAPRAESVIASSLILFRLSSGSNSLFTSKRVRTSKAWNALLKVIFDIVV